MKGTLLLFASLSLLAATAPLDHYNDGVAQLEGGQLEKAIEGLEAAAVSAEGPLRAAALFNLGLAHARRGDELRESGAEVPEEPESPDARMKRLADAASSYRRALALFRRVPPPAADADEGARAAKVRLLAVLDEIAKLAEEAKRKEEEEALSNPPQLLLTTLTGERDRRRAATRLTDLTPRRRRIPARRLRLLEYAARTLMEKLAAALATPPEGEQPGAVQIPPEIGKSAAEAVLRGATAMGEAEGRLDGRDGAGASEAQSRAIGELGAAARRLPILLPPTVDKLIGDQESLLGLTKSGTPPLLATEQMEITAWLAHLTRLPDPPAAPAPSGEAGPETLSADTAKQIRELAGDAEAAGGRSEEHLRAKRAEESTREQEIVVEKLRAIRELLPRPPESPAEKIRKLIAEENEVRDEGRAVSGSNPQTRSEEFEGLGERQVENGRTAGSIAEELNGSPGEQEKAAAEKVKEAEVEIHASAESFRRDQAEPAEKSIDRGIESLEEALRILSGEQEDQQNDQQDQNDQGDEDQHPPEENRQDARKLDSRDARRLMEEMDRERREEEQKLFRGLGGPKVEKDW